MWPSANKLAVKLGAAVNHSRLKRQVKRLKENSIHTIAKLDVFADHRLAEKLPGYSILQKTTSLPWSDANGLYWSNPRDTRVWEYNIALAKELAQIGFDEIQFDYVRFSPVMAISLKSIIQMHNQDFPNPIASLLFLKKPTWN